MVFKSQYDKYVKWKGRIYLKENQKDIDGKEINKMKIILKEKKKIKNNINNRITSIQEKEKRNLLSKFPILGRVINWNEKGFGWIRSYQNLTNIPGAHKNNGKVFVHKNDLIGIKELESNKEVSFLLYVDQKGLGAHCVTTNINSKENAKSYFFNESKKLKTVISLCIENMYISGLIGKKGTNIKILKNKSGARIDVIEDVNEKQNLTNSKLVNVTGVENELKEVCKLIAKYLAELSQSLYAKLVFLIHQSQAGRLIGKKGVNLRKIRGEKRTTNIKISKEPITVNNQPLVTMTLFGPKQDMEHSVEEAVSQLSNIYQSMLENFNIPKCTHMNNFEFWEKQQENF